MCRSRAACDSEPVRPMRSSSAILPGPTACLRPKSTRKRMAGIGMRCRQVGRGAWVALVAAVLPRYIQMNITIGAARTSSVRTVILEHGKMRKQILTAAAILTGCAAATGAAAVDIGADTRVGGQIFFDVSHISLQNENCSGARIDAAPTGTGFDVKRFYLSIDHRFNDVWSADLTTDAQLSTASTATVTTSTGNTTVLTNQNSSGGVSEVFIKKLYLEGKFDRAFVVHIGSYDMPWDRFVESLYGYRYIEKTTTDRLGPQRERVAWGWRPGHVRRLGSQRRRIQESDPHEGCRLRGTHRREARGLADAGCGLLLRPPCSDQRQQRELSQQHRHPP